VADSSWNFKRTFRRSRLLGWPSAFATLMYGVWWQIHSRFGHHFSADETQLLIGVAGFIGVFHGIIAAMTITKADTGRREMHRALNCGEFVQFVDLRDERIFWPIHWMLGSFSFMIIVCVMIIHYSTWVTGTFTVTAVSFLLAIYWQAANVTDKPLSSGWYRNDDIQIPEEYRTMTRAQAELRMEERKLQREAKERFRVRPYEFDTAQFRFAAERFGQPLR
jgi:hypothetical protein